MGLWRDWMHMEIEYYVEGGQPKEASEMPPYSEPEPALHRPWDREKQFHFYWEKGIHSYHVYGEEIVQAIRAGGYICDPEIGKDGWYYTDIPLTHGQKTRVLTGLAIVRHGMAIQTWEDWEEEIQQHTCTRH